MHRLELAETSNMEDCHVLLLADKIRIVKCDSLQETESKSTVSAKVLGIPSLTPKSPCTNVMEVTYAKVFGNCGRAHDLDLDMVHDGQQAGSPATVPGNSA